MSKDAKHAQAFRALAHPRRMRIFRLLTQQPHAGDSVQNLYGIANIPEASFRHHLREMEHAGLIKRHRKGQIVRVSVTPLALSAAMGTAQLLLQSRTA